MAGCLIQNCIFEICKFCICRIFKYNTIYGGNDEKREEGFNMMGSGLRSKCFSGEIVNSCNCCCTYKPYNFRLFYS